MRDTGLTVAEVWTIAGIISGVLLASLTLLFTVHVYIMKKVRAEAGNDRYTSESLHEHRQRIENLERQTNQLAEMQSDMKNLRDDFHHMRTRLDKVIDLYIASHSSKTLKESV